VGRRRVGTTVKVGFLQSFDAGWMRLWDVSTKGEWWIRDRERWRWENGWCAGKHGQQGGSTPLCVYGCVLCR
jgi:hypothetical protein